MVRSIERIERDIAALEQAIAAIAQELQIAYASYLSTLGQAVRQQLILASYHLCTHGYPHNFLHLSLSQRQHLQQDIRNLGKQATEQLLALTSSEHQQPQQFPDITILEKQHQAVSSSTTTSNTSETPTVFNPVQLLKWQQYLEKSIQEILKIVSREANLLLQKAGILPKKLPESILEAAVAASEASSAAAEVVPGPPNLINIVIEIENEKQSEESSLTQIMAIKLRLGEIEFADPKLSSERKKVRTIQAQLHNMGVDYQKKQQERAIALAEAAWRASWFED
jgi:hypothetical protein